MASPWPALGLLSITCCSCSRCVPGRINSRLGRAGGGGGVQSPAGAGAQNSVSPPPARSLGPWPCHVLLCFRGWSRLPPWCALSLTPASLLGFQCCVQPQPLSPALRPCCLILAVLLQVSFCPLLLLTPHSSTFHSFNRQILPGLVLDSGI